MSSANPEHLIDLDVTDVAHGGVFVGRHEGRVVFVPDAIPGERVRVRVTDDSKASFWRGDVVEVLDASPHRRAHVWSAADLTTPAAERPGGADFGHIALDHQRELKAQVLRSALERFGGVTLPVTVEPAHAVSSAAEAAGEHPDGLGWRTRVSLHVDEQGRVGPFAARSHRVVEVDDLPLVVPELQEAALRARASGGHAPGRLDLVLPSDGVARVRAIPEAPARGGSRRRGTRPAPRRGDDTAPGEVVIERVGGREFRVDAGGFWQVHRLAAQTLTDVVADSIRDIEIDPEAEHLDLYGGVGLLAAAVGDVIGDEARVTTVESDPRATEHAAANLAEWRGARAQTGRVDRWLPQFAAGLSAAERARVGAGVVVLDPPRAGAGRAVVDAVAELAPAHVVYVACDPVALARDVDLFGAQGYETRSVRGLDLFPHSHHVEAVAVLTRR